MCCSKSIDLFTLCIGLFQANMQNLASSSEQTLPNMSTGEVASIVQWMEQGLANNTLANMSQDELANHLAEAVLKGMKDLTLEARFKNVPTDEGRFATDPNLWFCWWCGVTVKSHWTDPHQCYRLVNKDICPSGYVCTSCFFQHCSGSDVTLESHESEKK